MMLAAAPPARGLRSRWAPGRGAPGRRRASREGRAPGPGPIGPAQCCGGIMTWTRTPAQGAAKGAGRPGSKAPAQAAGQNRAGRPARTRRAGQTVGGTSPGRRRASNFRPRQGRLGGHWSSQLGGQVGTWGRNPRPLVYQSHKEVPKLATSRYRQVTWHRTSANLASHAGAVKEIDIRLLRVR
jgi:hypothetical protein